MGLLVNGIWHDQWYDTDTTDGDFKREAAKLRNWVTNDGRTGPAGAEGNPVATIFTCRSLARGRTGP